MYSYLYILLIYIYNNKFLNVQYLTIKNKNVFNNHDFISLFFLLIFTEHHSHSTAKFMSRSFYCYYGLPFKYMLFSQFGKFNANI